jgi:hypothetical protein
MTRVIDPLIADLQLEHEQAMRAGPRSKAWLVRILAGIAFVKVTAICLYRDGMFRRTTWTTGDRIVLARVLVWSSAVMIVVIVLLELPFVSHYAVELHELSPMRFVYLIPQALSLALPIGATFGVVLGLGGRPIAARVRVACLAVAVLTSAVAFVNVAWVTPAANQAFRLLVSGQPVEPGIGELPLGQLLSEINRLNHDPALVQTRRLLALSFVYHYRIALSFSPLVLVFFALSMLSASVMWRWILIAAACVAFFSYYTFLLGARSLVFASAAPAYAAAWFPNVAVAVVSVVMAIRFQRRPRARQPQA